MLFLSSIINFVAENIAHADVAELADALDLGSSALAWGFESLHPHKKSKHGYKSCLFFCKFA